MIQILLFPLSLLFEVITSIRNFCFDIGIFKTYKSAIPVISIGNITVGGTGKTPLVLFLAEKLIADGRKPVILSRGYKGKRKGPALVVTDFPSEQCASSSEATTLYGDEPVLMALRKLCPVVIARKRVDGAKMIEQEKLGDIILLDDGYQHRWLSRDIDIVCIDCSCDASIKAFQDGKLLPSGIFRENKKNGLKRASYFCFSFRRIIPPHLVAEQYQKTVNVLSQDLGETKNFASYFSGMEVKNSKGDILNPCHVIPLAGIAKPQGFLTSLKDLGFSFDDTSLLFSDHHQFSTQDISRIDDLIRSGVPIVCTEKDLVRLPEDINKKVYVLYGTLALETTHLSRPIFSFTSDGITNQLFL
jgi:tetraacyldisaccharide 4'-kinase